MVADLNRRERKLNLAEIIISLFIKTTMYCNNYAAKLNVYALLQRKIIKYYETQRFMLFGTTVSFIRYSNSHLQSENSPRTKSFISIGDERFISPNIKQARPRAKLPRRFLTAYSR